MASTYLYKTFGTPTNNKKWTYSYWVKLANASDKSFLSCGSSTATRGIIYHNSGGNGTIEWLEQKSSSTTSYLVTNQVFRDVNGWYHFVFNQDSTQATASDRIKMYVNGEQVTSFSTSTYPSQNYDSVINSAIRHDISGRNNHSSSDFYIDGSMAHVHFIDGTAYDASTFGETDSTSGIWKPKTSPSVTYGTNGFFLKFQDSSSLGDDSSGNTNDFTLSGSGIQILDTPSNVFTTMNAIDNRYQADTLSNGNLTMVGGGQYAPRTATFGLTTGKWYWEIETNNFQSADGSAFGISSEVASAANYEYYNQSGDNVGYGYFSNGQVYGNGSSLASGYGTGSGTHVIGVAVNLDDNKIAFSYDGTWQGSTDPGSGNTNMISITAPSSLATKTYFPAFTQKDQTRTVNVNFGNGYFGTTAISSPENDDAGYGKFKYNVPTGYYALCTKNINTYG